MDHEPPNPESLIFVPLIFRDEVLGVLSVQQLHPNAFDDKDLAIMTLLGNQVALAISDLRLVGYLEDLNKAGQQLKQNISSETMLGTVVDRIRDVTKADIVMLYPYVQNSELPLEHRFGDPHASGELLQPRNIRKTVKEDDIAWLALRGEEPIWAVDSRELFQLLSDEISPARGNFASRERVVSTAVLALQIEGEPIGVLFINYRHRQDFMAPQRNLISGLANFAAIAIYNNRQFRYLYQHRLAELEAFRQIELDISKSLRLDDVLQAILRRASQMIRTDTASIYLTPSSWRPK